MVRTSRGLIMKCRFHQQRKQRYSIAIQKLRDVFHSYKGWELLLELHLKPKVELSIEEDRIIYLFRKLIAVLNRPSKFYARTYIKLNYLLRKVMKLISKIELKEPWHKRLNHLLLQFCLTKYHRTHFYSFGSSLLKEMFSILTLKGDSFNYHEHFENYTFQDEALIIENSTPLVHLERQLRKLDEQYLKRYFDSHRYNLPSLLYTFAFFRQGQLMKIKMVRMPCPTKESWIQKPTIINEFKGFLISLRNENKNHLYVNKQKTWGEEGRRSSKIIELEKEFDHFFCVCLPSDGEFYYQTNRFKNIQTLQDFKVLFDKMLRGKVNLGYYHLPEKWKEDSFFCSGLRKILDDVHELYFKGATDLSAQHRHLFIDIAYTHLILYFLDYALIHSINITCRDGIDRAGCEQTKLLYYFQTSLGIENEISSKKDRQFVQHIPVYLAKNRPIVRERRKILENVFNLMNGPVRKNIFESHRKNPLLSEAPHFVRRSFENLQE